ncbi:MAG: lipoprotein [Gammaproteobacteria bacterium]|nr:lipoprotein [Gammaproteobacteria bacterium]
MKILPSITLILVTVLSLSLAACGQKGPLYLPENKLHNAQS